MKQLNALFIGPRIEAYRAFSTTLTSWSYKVDVMTPHNSRIAQSKIPHSVECFPASKAETLNQLKSKLAAQHYDLVLSAGFPYIIPGPLLKNCPTLFINSHPHILPEYPGINAIRESFSQGETNYGCTVHKMTAVVDDGEVLAEARHCLAPKNLETIYQLVFEFLEPATIIKALCLLRERDKITR